MTTDQNQLTDSELYHLFYPIVREIPEGKVASYGQIALLAGCPEDARHVGHALSVLNDSDIPWHRVVMRSGEIAERSNPGERERQYNLLKQEGVEFITAYHVHMERSGWQKVPPGGLFG